MSQKTENTKPSKTHLLHRLVKYDTSIAIGDNCKALHKNTLCIGNNLSSYSDNQILIDIDSVIILITSKNKKETCLIESIINNLGILLRNNKVNIILNREI